MSDSLRDQLLKAGLVTKKQATQAERQQHQQQHQRVKGGPGAKQPQQRQQASAQALAAKAERDKALNRERQAKAEAKARLAQFKQLVEQHRIPRPESDDYFNFVDRGKVRRIPVVADIRSRLVKGSLSIVRCDGHYELVPQEKIELIKERDPDAVVALPPGDDDRPADDDPYKDFVVPDDLTW
jgi:hypothetical protein